LLVEAGERDELATGVLDARAWRRADHPVTARLTRHANARQRTDISLLWK